MNFVINLVEQIGIYLLGEQIIGIEAVKRLLYILWLVHKVKNVGIFLVRVNAVNKANGLDNLDVLKLFDDNQRVQ